MPAPPGAGARTEFTHLHVASSYSLRYGTATPRALAARAADLGMPALALTDRDGLYGAFKHVQACADAGIKALLGADLALRFLPGAQRPLGTPRPRWPVPPRDEIDGQHGQPNRVTLLAAGRQAGPRCAASSPPPTPGRRRRRQKPGGTASSARPTTTSRGHQGTDRGARRRPCRAARPVERRRPGGRRPPPGPGKAATRPLAAPGPCTAVLEIVDHLDHKSTFRAARMAELARDSRTKAVLTNAVRYLDPVDSLAAQVLDAARHLVPLARRGGPAQRPRLSRRPGDMTDTANRVANAMTGPGTASAAAGLLAETDELASRCVLDAAYDLGVGTHHLPETEGSAYDQYKELRDRCEYAILHGRYRTASADGRPRGVSRLKAAQQARDRLEHELDIIARTGMAAYFLTVADVADRIRHAGIRCAIRGSGAGSFVNHLLGISAIDPLEHDLLMERFLSPIRATLPGHRPGRGVGPPPRRVPDHLRPLRRGAHRLRLHDGDLPGAQRDQGRRRRDVAAARRDRRDRQGLPAHPRQAHHRRAHRAARNSAGQGSTTAQLATIFKHRGAARRPAAARRHAPVRRAAVR